MEKGVRFIGNGQVRTAWIVPIGAIFNTINYQAPVHKYWEEILHDYIKTGKFDIKLILT